MVTTTANFWKVIQEQHCGVVLMLSDCTEKGQVLRVDIVCSYCKSDSQEVCHPYWPASADSVRVFGDYTVTAVDESITQYYTEHSITVSSNDSTTVSYTAQTSLASVMASFI